MSAVHKELSLLEKEREKIDKKVEAYIDELKY